MLMKFKNTNSTEPKKEFALSKISAVIVSHCLGAEFLYYPCGNALWWRQSTALKYTMKNLNNGSEDLPMYALCFQHSKS